MDERLAGLVASLEERGFVSDGISKWGRPVPAVAAVSETVRVPAFPPGPAPVSEPASETASVPEPTSDAPQALNDASPLQRRLVECSYGTPSPGKDLCASWVEQCFSRLGLGVVLGDAATLYKGYCHHTEERALKVGMIVAVPSQPYSLAGMEHGHVGLYIGDGLVRDAVAQEVRTVPLELWLTAYGLICEPRWGWLGGIGLD